MTCRVIETTSEFQALRERWNDLLARSQTFNPFLTWEWMYSWWLHYGEIDTSKRLAIVVASEGDALVALLPTYVRHPGVAGTRVRTLTFLGTPHESSDYLDVIQEDPERSDLLPALVQHVQSHVPVDRFRLAGVLDSSPTCARLRCLVSAAGLPCRRYHLRTCPYLPIAGQWSDYLASLGPSFRQTLGRRTRRFFEQETAEFDWVRDEAELSPAVQTLFALHEQRFADKNARTKFVSAVRGEFHARVSRWFFDSNRLRLFRLRMDGQTIATLYCFEYGGCLFYYQGGIDPAWSRHSVGTVLMGQVIKYAFDQGLTHFDFLRGSEAYKFKWTNHTREIVVLDVGLTWTGRAAVAASGLLRNVG